MARRIRVYGRVQGVSYRAWTVKQANRLGLSGWVRNRLDGSVEMLVDGAPEALVQLSEACRKGPMLAVVDRLEQEESDEAVGEGFVQRPTA